MPWLALLVVAAHQMHDGARPIRLYESLRRMSPYPIEHPYAPSSFVRTRPLSDGELLEAPHKSTAEALRRHLRSALPGRATAPDGTPRRVSILEITGCGDSFTPRASRDVGVTRLHLSEASRERHAASLRGGRGDELAADFVQDASGDEVLLPYADCSFDAVVVSFCAPALSRPFELLAELNRVLAQDAPAIVALGGPLKPGQANAMWAGMPAETQLYVLGSYFHYTDSATDGWYEEISAQHAHGAPPLFLMTARRLGGAAYMWRRIENDRAYRQEEEEDWRLERPRGASRAPLFTGQGGVTERWPGPSTWPPSEPAQRAEPALPYAPAAAAYVPKPALHAYAPESEPATGWQSSFDGRARAVVGSAEAEAHARDVRAAAAATARANLLVAPPPFARKKILDVVQAGVEKALAARERRGDSLSTAEREVLDRLRSELHAAGGEY
ncbi:hypothetical protein T492DRAFT_1107099 [Pavlovales sp. CCMP2436]|nr:hypothetical protein T492DRAFT_1107099 [Pavlovales sp. CCMP2436]|mmetsp:Transcript_26623/g.62258  ORF Transcript_26623/g.62258 Transcript_26623/m.62258 type:complete len:444 (+) Transcript_26623:131-1462(+)